MKCLDKILNSLLLSMILVICFQFSYCSKSPYLLEDRPTIPTSYPKSPKVTKFLLSELPMQTLIW